MRLFSNRQTAEVSEPEQVINLLWRYEVSEDGGKTWYPEDERTDEGCYVLRRGAWVSPPLN